MDFSDFINKNYDLIKEFDSFLRTLFPDEPFITINEIICRIEKSNDVLTIHDLSEYQKYKILLDTPEMICPSIEDVKKLIPEEQRENSKSSYLEFIENEELFESTLDSFISLNPTVIEYLTSIGMSPKKFFREEMGKFFDIV
jgi:hypothetical protein